MRLYLVRHGEANPKSVDPSRSLTQRGIEDAVTIGNFLASQKAKPDFIFSSDKTRALKTAEIIAGNLGYREDEIVVSQELIPNAHPKTIGNFLSSYGLADTMIVIGHLPSIGVFTSYLITPDLEVTASISFETCGIACLEGDDVVRPGGFVLKSLISPGLIL